eukprot:170867_1
MTDIQMQMQQYLTQYEYTQKWTELYTNNISKITLQLISKSDKAITKYNPPYTFTGKDNIRLLDVLKKFLHWASIKRIPKYKLYGIFSTEILAPPARNILHERTDLRDCCDLKLLITILHEMYP